MGVWAKHPERHEEKSNELKECRKHVVGAIDKNGRGMNNIFLLIVFQRELTNNYFCDNQRLQKLNNIKY